MTQWTSDPRLVAHLNDLIHLDFDAIEAYEAAIVRLSEIPDKTQMVRFLADRQRHVVDLSSLVRELGGVAVTRSNFKRVLTKGRVVIAALIGDRTVLEAMRSNEEATVKTYRKAVTEPGLPTLVREILERNLADGQRHLAWVNDRLSVALPATQR
jgi:uncharacterized protein (TIGR02284 family)